MPHSQVEVHYAAFKDKFSFIHEYNSPSPSRPTLVQHLRQFADAVQSYDGPGKADRDYDGYIVLDSSLDLTNLDYFLVQAQHDPYFDQTLLESWKAAFESWVLQVSRRFEGAMLWELLVEEDAAVRDGVECEVGDDQDDDKTLSDGDFPMDVPESSDSQSKLPLDVAQFAQHLTDLFSPLVAKEALHHLRGKLQLHGTLFLGGGVDPYVVTAAMHAPWVTTVSPEIQESVEKVHKDIFAVEDVASGFHKRILAIDQQKPAEVQDILNRPSYALLDPRLFDIIFLDTLSLNWHIKLKEALLEVFDGPAWTTALPQPSRILSLDDFSRLQDRVNSIREARWRNQRSLFFLNGLYGHPAAYPPSSWSGHRDSEMCTLRAGCSVRPTGQNIIEAAVAEKNRDDRQKEELRRSVLHTIQVESYVNMELRGSFGVLKATLLFDEGNVKQAALIALAFFGVPQAFIDLFFRFIAPSSVPKIPGAETSEYLDVLLREALLFILDFAVNSRSGLFVHRYTSSTPEDTNEEEDGGGKKQPVPSHDLWLWDSDNSKLEKGKREIERFTRLIGASVRFESFSQSSSTTTSPPESPLSNTVNWRLLHFDTHNSIGRFTPSLPSVLDFADVWKRRLHRASSTLAWVREYNKGTRDLLRGLGVAGLNGPQGTAECFGRAFVEDVSTAVQRCLEHIFDGVYGPANGPVGYLRSRLYGLVEGKTTTTTANLVEFVRDLPEALFYWPQGAGGFGLHNPFIELCATRSGLRENGPLLVDSSDDTDPRQRLQRLHDLGEYENLRAHELEQLESGKPPPVSLDDFLVNRDGYPERWTHLYLALLKPRSLKTAYITPTLQMVVSEECGRCDAGYIASRLRAGSGKTYKTSRTYNLKGRDKRDMELDWHEFKWTVSMYGESIVRAFGKLDVVERDMLEAMDLSLS